MGYPNIAAYLHGADFDEEEPEARALLLVPTKNAGYVAHATCELSDFHLCSGEEASNVPDALLSLDSYLEGKV